MAVSVEQVSSLKMKLNKLDAEKSSYYSENLRLSQELSKNAKNLEVVKRNLSKLPVLEAERDDLQGGFQLQDFIITELKSRMTC